MNVNSCYLNELGKELTDNFRFVTLYQALFCNIHYIISQTPGEDEVDREAWEYLLRTWEKFANRIDGDRFSEIYGQVLLTRDIDAFQRYLTKMLSRIYNERPETLKSSEKVEIQNVLKFENMEDFVSSIAEKRVLELSYKGMREILEFLKNKHGLEINCCDSKIATAIELIEVRNIVVHNAGIVRDLFIKRTKRNDLIPGQPFPLNMRYYPAGKQKDFRDVAESIDKAILEHFNLVPCPHTQYENGDHLLFDI